MKIAILATLALMIMVMLTTPVLALGPWQAADDNPLLTFDPKDPAILNLETSSGVTIRWQNGAPDLSPYKSRDRTFYLPASKADVDDNLKNAAMVLLVWDGPVWTGSRPSFMSKLGSWIGTWIFTKLTSTPALALEYENKWIYMSSDYVRGMWFMGYYLKGMSVQDASNYASYFADVLWPNGVYFKYNNVGQ